MNTQRKLSWQAGDLGPSWLQLISERDRDNLLALLCAADRLREEQAYTMLVAPPLPTDETDAQARVSTVIQYLAGGYRVGDRHPTTELLTEAKR